MSAGEFPSFGFNEMIYQLTVPAVADVEEIRVLEWHGEIGHRFHVGDLIVELETHKAIVEVRAGQPGIVRVVMLQAGDWQQIGEPLAIFSDHEEEEVSAEAASALAVEFQVS
jgi:pyruvate/2-oxoglutarate dehydrogenase complex dihydrolipoamide acyltransferase (E2) component